MCVCVRMCACVYACVCVCVSERKGGALMKIAYSPQVSTSHSCQTQPRSPLSLSQSFAESCGVCGVCGVCAGACVCVCVCVCVCMCV